MAHPNLTSRELALEKVTIWYDTDEDLLRLTSNDPDLNDGVLDFAIERGTRADAELREAFSAYGLDKSPPARTAAGPHRTSEFLRFSPGSFLSGIPLTVDLAREGNLVVQGAVGAGRSALLRHMIDELATGGCPSTLEVRVLGRGPLTLRGLREPHPSGVVTYAAHEMSPGECLADLVRSLSLREDILAGSGASSIEEYNDTHPSAPLRHVVVVLDCAEQCLEEWASIYTVEDVQSDLNQILTVGPLLGAHVIFSRCSAREEGDMLAGTPSISIGEDGASWAYSDGLSEVPFVARRGR